MSFPSISSFSNVAHFCLSESSTKLSLERAREYDRVSEWLSRNKKPNTETHSDPLDRNQQHYKAEYGIEGRRLQFQKDSYRQPVLTRKPMIPKNYRRGQPDPEAEFCINRLRDLSEQHRTSMSVETFDKESMEASTTQESENCSRNIV